MGAGMLIGALLVAYGPALAVFFSYVWGDAALLILAVASAFVAYFWTLFTSFFWLAVPPLRDVHVWPAIVNPLIAEALRAAFLVGYTRVERLTDRMSSPLTSPGKVFVDLPAAVAAGSGAGILLTVMKYGATLATAGGRAGWYYPTCPAMSAYILNAVSALLTNVLHIALTVLLLDALRRKSWPRAALTVSTHVLFSMAGALTALQDGCVAVLPIQALLVLTAVYASVRAVAAPDYSGRRQVRAWALLREHAIASMDSAAGANRTGVQGQGQGQDGTQQARSRGVQGR